MKLFALFAISALSFVASAGVVILDCDRQITITLDRNDGGGTLKQDGKEDVLNFIGLMGGMEMYQKKSGAQDFLLISPYLASGQVNQDRVSISESSSINCHKK